LSGPTLKEHFCLSAAHCRLPETAMFRRSKLCFGQYY